MKERQRRRTANCMTAIFFAGLFVMSTVLPIFATNQEKTVRVGYYLVEGMQNQGTDGKFSGYTYDYLQGISQYTGWHYEFVVATWDECADMLEKGEIDLLGAVTKTKEREKIFDYADQRSGIEGNRIVTAGDNAKFSYEDYGSFDGMSVAVATGSARAQGFAEYQVTHGFSAQMIPCDSQEEVLKAVDQGKVDAALISISRAIEGYRVIAEYDTEPFYFATTKGNTEILSQLNLAIKKMKSIDANFDDNLRNKYFNVKMGYAPIFTEEEKDYIKKHPTVKAIYDPEWGSIEYQDPKTGEYSGIMADFYQLISKSTGLLFEFKTADNFSRAMKVFQNEKLDIVTALNCDYNWAEQNNVYLTSAFLNAPVVEVFSGKGNGDGILALPVGYYTSGQAAMDTKVAKIQYYDTISECFEALRNGAADYTMVNMYAADYYLSKPQYTRMNFHSIPGMYENIAIAVSKDADPLLLSILNKTVNGMNESQIRQIIRDSGMEQSQMHVTDIFYTNPKEAMIVITLVLALIITLLSIILETKVKQNKELKERREEDDRIKGELKYRAEIDEISGIYNRRTFYAKTQKMIQENNQIAYTLIRWDMERFKVYNDLFGIEGGDQLIHFIGDLLKEILNEKGTYGRITADHFAMCLSNGSFNIEELVDELTARVNENETAFEIVLRFGIYQIDDVTVPVNLMCDRAKLALQVSRQNYFGYYAYYDKKLRSALIEEQEIVDEMDNALVKKEFCIYLQPIYSLSELRIVSAEALVRWNHPTRGMILPGEFLSIFEKNGFIAKLDWFVWEETCKYLKEGQRIGKPEIPISVNVSRLSLYNPNLRKELLNLLEKYKIPTRLFRLEITETVYAESPTRLIESIRELQEDGFEILMDDFGSGYSSLNMLKDVAVDTLKLDMHFIENMDKSGRAGNILTSVVRMAKWLNLSVIAEGVETKEQLDFLRSIGCNCIQGYIFSAPLNPEEFNQVLEAKLTPEIKSDFLEFSESDLELLFDGNMLANRLINSIIGGVGLYEFVQGCLEVVRVNDRYFDILGYDPQSFFEKDGNVLGSVFEEDRGLVLTACKQVVQTKGDCRVVVRRYHHREKQILWLDICCRYLGGTEERPVLCITFNDITEQKNREIQARRHVERKLRKKAEMDAVTEIYNRATTEEMVEDILRGFDSGKFSVFLMIDMDNFKEVNDTHGHLLGDRLLKRVAAVLSENLRKSDLAGRVGGDEFVVLLNGVGSMEMALHKAEAFADKISKIQEELKLEIPISCSMGVVPILKEDTSFTQIFEKADQALYLAKKKGKNCCAIFRREGN